MSERRWFATCPKGLESLLLAELGRLGGADLRETVAGCHFSGNLAVGYRVALWSRLSNRILLPIAEFPVGDSGTLHAGMLALNWTDYLAVTSSFVVDFSGESRAIRNTQYGAQVCKDAIVDYFRARGAERPNVSRRDADIRLNVRLRKGAAVVAIDFAGTSLHQRGYRQEAGLAPLKENLAAAILLRADWPTIAADGGALIDPMCGSGTLLLEAAMMVADIAPGLARERWGFMALPFHNSQQWQAILADATSRAERGRLSQLPEIRGYDADPQVIKKAEANIERAGLQQVVRVSCKALANLSKPTHKPLPTGLVITNPPYGERLGQKDSLYYLYRELGAVLLREFAGWQAAILTGDKELGIATGLRSHKRYALFNGRLPATLLLFELDNASLRQQRPEKPLPLAVETAAEWSSGAQMLANRLQKNRKKMERWAAARGISCYRLYDADMPEYAVAIDRYEDALYVAEYRAPKSVAEEAAGRRLGEIKQVLPEVFATAAEQIYYKQRERQRGTRQYQRQAQTGELRTVHEGAVKLLVNLGDYLDTGLFLDHRLLRRRIAAEAKGRHFLNLFCYTAAASVHAAAGGARSTTSVDMSNTYLDWARKNFAANGFGEGQNILQRADCLAWLRACERKYDLILLDPPSFSNSKRMQDSFDVQRDHSALLKATLQCLGKGGVLYFSNNLRSFKLDPTLAEVCQLEEISRATIDVDYQRRPNIHRCWRITHQD